jgi:CHASE1-domain containing sensor protein
MVTSPIELIFFFLLVLAKLAAATAALATVGKSWLVLNKPALPFAKRSPFAVAVLAVAVLAVAVLALVLLLAVKVNTLSSGDTDCDILWRLH